MFNKPVRFWAIILAMGLGLSVILFLKLAPQFQESTGILEEVVPTDQSNIEPELVFRIQEARAEGYTDDEIVKHLAERFERVTEAVNKGATPEQVLRIIYETAFRELKAEAEAGDRQAQFNLGRMFYNGYGVPEDYKEAVKWYRLAAEQGVADAQYNLGLMYSGRQGVAQDYQEAVKWFRLAAEQGFAEAQHNLGVMYGDGKGVPQDYVQAHMWFNLAAAEGIEAASEARDTVAQRMTPEQIAEAQKLAREWMEKHQDDSK